MRIFFVFLITTVVSSGACAEARYTLKPVGSDEIADVLGGNTAKKASDFFDFMKNTWKIPTVEPSCMNGSIVNIKDLIPSEVIVVPDLVTVHTSQVRGGRTDDNRMKTQTVSPLPATVNPAEDSVFIYAFNKSGALINPLALKPIYNSIKCSGYVSTYNIQAFQEHTNLNPFLQPIVTNTDVDISGTYDKGRPNMNPPNALMFRGRSVGQYSLTLAVQFNHELLTPSTTPDVRLLASKIVTKTVEVNVVDGPETIDQLLFNSSKSLGLHEQKNDLAIAMKEGDELEVSLSGQKNRKIWHEGKQQYLDDGSLTVMLKQVNWNYRNDTQKPSSPYDKDLIFIRKLTADGTVVRIVANELPSSATEGVGTINIEAHGRKFVVTVRVAK